MRTYARIQDGAVAEIIDTGLDITQLFVPSLLWVDISSQAGIKSGWLYDGKGFSPPPKPALTPHVPTVSEIQARLATISAQLAALSQAK